MASSTISGAVPRRPSVYDENSWRTPLIYVETPEDVVLPNLFTEGHDIMRRGLKKYYGKKIPDLIRRGEDVEASAVISNWKDARLYESSLKQIQRMDLDFKISAWSANTIATLDWAHAVLNTITIWEEDKYRYILHVPQACRNVRLHSRLYARRF